MTDSITIREPHLEDAERIVNFYNFVGGVIELRRTLHHYLSERCFA